MRERGRIRSDDCGLPGGCSGEPFCQCRDEPRESIVVVIKGTACLTAASYSSSVFPLMLTTVIYWCSVPSLGVSPSWLSSQSGSK